MTIANTQRPCLIMLSLAGMFGLSVTDRVFTSVTTMNTAAANLLMA